MRILVIGAGAVGGYFGARLAQTGRDVTFLVRGERAAQLHRDGLRISGLGHDFTVKPQLITAAGLRDAPPFDLLLLSTKAYSLGAAMHDFAPAVGRGTAILPLLNGMRHLDDLAAHFGRPAVLGGVSRIVADLDAEGRIVLGDTLHEITFGELDCGLSPRIQAIREILANAGFDAVLSPDMLAAMWRKWVLLSTLGSVCCLGRGSIGQIARAPAGPDLVHAVLAETVAIARANGFPHDDAFLQEQRRRFTDPASTLTSSMYRDLLKGAPVEADHILGDLLARAPRALALPLVRAAFVQLSVYTAARQS